MLLYSQHTGNRKQAKRLWERQEQVSEPDPGMLSGYETQHIKCTRCWLRFHSSGLTCPKRQEDRVHGRSIQVSLALGATALQGTNISHIRRWSGQLSGVANGARSARLILSIKKFPVTRSPVQFSAYGLDLAPCEVRA